MSRFPSGWLTAFISVALFLSSQVALSSDWGPWVTSSAFPLLDVRVRHYGENRFVEEPDTQIWLLSIRNNYASEISVSFEITDIDETVEAFKYRRIIPAGVEDDIWVNFFERAKEDEQVMVWLGNLKIDGVAVDGPSIGATKSGGSEYSVGFYGGGDGDFSGETSAGVSGEPSNPCGTSLSFTNSYLEVDLDVPATQGTAVASINTTGSSCPVSYRFSSNNSFTRSFGFSGNTVIVDALEYSINAQTYPSVRMNIVADNGYHSDLMTLVVNHIGGPVINIVHNQVFAVRTSATLNSTFGQIEAEYYQGDTANITYSILDGNSDGIFALSSSGNLTVQDTTALSAISELTEYTLNISATDGVTQDTASISVVVTPNNAPVVSSLTYTIPQLTSNGYRIGNIAAVELDGDLLSYYLVEPPPMSLDQLPSIRLGEQTGLLQVDDYSFFAFPAFGPAERTYSFDVLVSDGFYETTTTLYLDVVANESPTISPSTFDLAINSKNTFIPVGFLDASDPEGNPMYFDILAGDDNNMFSIDAGGQLWADLTRQTQGSYSLTIQVVDELEGIGSAALVTVNMSSAPKAEDLTRYVPVEQIGGGASFAGPEFTDADGDTLIYELESGASLFTINNDSGVVSFINSYNRADDPFPFDYYSVDISATDGAFSSIARLTLIPATAITDVNVTQASIRLWSPGYCGYRTHDISFDYDDTKGVTVGRVTYELVSGDGDDANELVFIDGNRIFTKGLSLEENTVYNVRIRATDALGTVIESAYSIANLEYASNPPTDFVDFESCVSGRTVNNVGALYTGQSDLVNLDSDALDLYRIYLTGTGDITLQSLGGLDLTATLKNSYGEVIAFDDDSGADGGFSISATGLPADTYSVLISGATDTIAGEYRIEATIVDSGSSATPTPTPTASVTPSPTPTPDGNGGNTSSGGSSGGGSSGPLFTFLLMVLFSKYARKKYLI